MRTVYKYSFSVSDDVKELEIPKGYVPVAVGFQDMQPAIVNMWAEVETNNPPIAQRFRIYGTGHEVDEPFAEYIGTAQNAMIPLVCHLYRV